MGKSLEQVLAEARDGARVNVSLTTNEDDGIAGYAEGSLVFHAAKGGVGPGTFRRSSLSTSDNARLLMYFSDRRLNIDPVPTEGFPPTPRQPFSANATEGLGASLSIGFGNPVLTIDLFGNSAHFPMSPSGSLLVGKGPQFGTSPEALWTLAFLGIIETP